MSPAASDDGPRCLDCGAALRQVAAFCPSCGRATRAHRVHVLRKTEKERSAAVAAGRTAAAVFAGCLLSIVAAGFAGRALDLPGPAVHLLGSLLLAATGVGASAVLGLRTIRETFPFRPRAADLGWAAAAAGAGVIAGAIWVETLLALGPGEAEATPPEGPLVLRIVATAVMPAVIEEWICRGVLWRPLRPLLGPRATILVTAILFAFLHGLGGGFLLEIPHRFAAGLLFGFVRERSGSLSTPMLAHFEHNAFWVLLGHA